MRPVVSCYGSDGCPPTYRQNMVVVTKLSREMNYAEVNIITSVISGPRLETRIIYERELHYLKSLCKEGPPKIKSSYIDVYSHPSRNSLKRVMDKNTKFYFEDLDSIKTAGWIKLERSDAICSSPITISILPYVKDIFNDDYL